MADIRPFSGLRFNPKRAGLTAALCPPYDVIGPDQARKLRRGRFNAIHLELPDGEGAVKYANSARLWSRWLSEKVILQDPKPAYYVVEERFSIGGRRRRRVGFLAALGVTPKAARWVVAHEHTLAKPKKDRLKLLKAVQANISPIFGIFPDAAGTLRRALVAAARKPAVAQGRTDGGVSYRLWRSDEPKLVAIIRKAMASKRILIADGHHRFEVSRAYYEQTRAPEAETILAYLCPEEDPGLVVLPTHRIASEPGLCRSAARLAKLLPCASEGELLRRLAAAPSPYAFGLYDRRFQLAAPKRRDGCRSGLCVEWIGRHLLKEIPPDRVRYTPDPRQAVKLARSGNAVAVFVKPFPVAQIRRAVRAVGLLPPKSTYFFPKIATGLVFKDLRRPAPSLSKTIGRAP